MDIQVIIVGMPQWDALSDEDKTTIAKACLEAYLKEISKQND